MPRRSSPIVITERKTGMRSLMTRRKNWRTPLLALARFLASLMTLVSTKYMICLVLVLSPLEVLVLSDIWHGGQNFRKALPGWQQQRCFKYGAVFGLSTPPMLCCPLLQRVNKALIKIPDYKVCHLSPFSANWMIAMIAYL